MTRTTLTLTIIAALATTAPANAAAPLTVREARNATRLASEGFAELMDATIVNVGACHRESAMRVRCKTSLRGAKQTCRWSSWVRQDGTRVLVSARGMRCTG